MKPLPLLALAAAAALSMIMTLDLVWNANHPDGIGPWLDAEAHPSLVRVTAIAHAATYLLIGAALVQAGSRIDGGRVFVRVLRWIIIAAYAVFAAMYVWTGVVDPAFAPTGIMQDVVNVAFLASLLVPVVLGFALLRRRTLRAAVILLIAPVVLLPSTMLLSLVGWGHPGYLETAVNVGLALLTVAASTEAVPEASASAGSEAATAAGSEGRSPSATP